MIGGRGDQPMWDRRRVSILLGASIAGEILLVVPGERLMGAALLGMTLAYALFFFRSVRLATRLERLLLESGDLDPDDDDDTAPMGASTPWAFLLFPAVYVAGLFDKYLEVVVTFAVWADLVRQLAQFAIVAMVHADLRHRVRLLTDPAYLQRALEAAKKQQDGDA